jgi:hypothetical protein
MVEGLLEKRREIWVDWTIAREKGVFKRPYFFGEMQERSPSTGECWRRGRHCVPIAGHFAVMSRALGLSSRRNRHCSFSGDNKRLTVKFVRQAKLARWKSNVTVSGVWGVTELATPTLSFLAATVMATSDAATRVFSPDLVTPHLERLLTSREWPKTICPSEAARALSSDEVKQSGATSWRDLMPAIRSYAFDLRYQDQIEILQKGQVLPQSQTLVNTTGPIRLWKK